MASPTNYLQKLHPLINTFSKVSIDAHVSGSACEALVLTIRNVFIGQRVNVLLSQPKVNDIHCVLIGHPCPPHQEVFWLHVPVDQVLAMNVFQSCDLELGHKTHTSYTGGTSRQ